MGAMRSASEQRLPARDCFDGSASACEGDHGRVKGPPSMECLMTLLWATKVIHRQWLRGQESLATEGAIKDIRQPSLEPNELFRLRSVGLKGAMENISLSGGKAVGSGKRIRNGRHRGVENGE